MNWTDSLEVTAPAELHPDWCVTFTPGLMTVDIQVIALHWGFWTWVLLQSGVGGRWLFFVVEACPVCCRVFSSIPGLHPWDGTSSPPIITTKNTSQHGQLPLEGTIIPIANNWCVLIEPTLRTWKYWYLVRDVLCSVEKAMAPHSSTLTWRIPWTEEPGGLQSMASHRVGRDWSGFVHTYTSCLGFPGGASGEEPTCQCRRPKRRSSVPGLERSPGGGNRNPPHYSCLESLMYRGAWRTSVHRVEKLDTIEAT